MVQSSGLGPAKYKFFQKTGPAKSHRLNHLHRFCDSVWEISYFSKISPYVSIILRFHNFGQLRLPDYPAAEHRFTITTRTVSCRFTSMSWNFFFRDCKGEKTIWKRYFKYTAVFIILFCRKFLLNKRQFCYRRGWVVVSQQLRIWSIALPHSAPIYFTVSLFHYFLQIAILAKYSFSHSEH